MKKREKPGPKTQKTEPTREFHLKIPASLAEDINFFAVEGYQAFFVEAARRYIADLNQAAEPTK